MIGRVERSIPQASRGDASPTTITAELNFGVDKVNLVAQVLKTFVNVQNTPGKQIYSLSAIAPGYFTMIKNGVWWWNTAGKSQIMWPKSKKWFDNYIPNWRDSATVKIPTWYWHEGDELGFFPASLASTATGKKDFQVNYLIKATPMSSNSNYPWTNTPAENTTFHVFDDAICAYATWKLAPAVMDQDGRNYYEGCYTRELAQSCKLFKKQLDLSSNFDYFMRSDAMGYSFLPRD